jgi:hypothetical protein
MMNRYEKWEHDRNMDEIVDRLAELLVNVMLMSIKQINDKFLIVNKRWEQNQPDDIPF